MITIRNFRNTDPPLILEFWGRVAQTRGFGRPSSCDALEQMLFAKPYFDRKGLFLAFEGRELVGLCHAGFGANDKATALDKTTGTVAMLAVVPEKHRQKIGSKLLTEAQDYLRASGAKLQYLGCLNPVNPFYLGLYGGSELSGILESDDAATKFAKKHGYTVADTCQVYQLSLEDLAAVEDNRIPLLRRKVEVQVEPWPMPLNWWHACQLGPMVALGYEMQDKESGAQIGRAWVWEMESYTRAWNTSCVGLTDVLIHEDFRKQGYGRLMLHSILKHLQGQKISLVEVQTMERNTAARALYESLGFSHVDTGHMYRLGSEPGLDTDLQDTAEFAAPEVDPFAKTQV